MTTELQSAPLQEEASPAQEEEAREASPQERTVQLLEELCQNSRRQEESLRAQLRMTRLCAGFLGGALALMVLAACILLPRVSSLFVQAQQTMDNLQTVTQDLSQIDFQRTAEGINDLIAQSGSTMETALEEVQKALSVIEGMDVEGLNAAISDLQRAIRPLADLFGG